MVDVSEISSNSVISSGFLLLSWQIMIFFCSRKFHCNGIWICQVKNKYFDYVIKLTKYWCSAECRLIHYCFVTQGLASSPFSSCAFVPVIHCSFHTILPQHDMRIHSSKTLLYGALPGTPPWMLFCLANSLWRFKSQLQYYLPALVFPELVLCTNLHSPQGSQSHQRQLPQHSIRIMV